MQPNASRRKPTALNCSDCEICYRLSKLKYLLSHIFCQGAANVWRAQLTMEKEAVAKALTELDQNRESLAASQIDVRIPSDPSLALISLL